MVFRGIKDSALALGLKAFLNERFGEYGEILDCSIDTDANQLHLSAMLVGEKEPLSASIDRYDLQREGEDMYVVIKSFSSSRQWVTRLLSRLLAGKRYKIPAPVAALL